MSQRVDPSLLRALALAGALALAATRGAGADPPGFVAGRLVELNDNGAWSWFMDERAVVDRGKLIVGSVRAVKGFETGEADPDWGNVEVAALDLATGQAAKTVLHRHFEQDDHDNPAFLVRPDGRYLAVYSKHSVERKLYVRVSAPGDPLSWGPANEVTTPGDDHAPFGGDNVTYANLYRMADGRVHNFYRGFSHDPNSMTSDDLGRTWAYGGRLLRGRDGYSPYLKYTSDGKDTVHFITTEDHPRSYDTSVYHGTLRGGVIRRSDVTEVGPMSRSTDTRVAAWDLTRVFQGDADNVAWVNDIELDRGGRPYLAISVQKDGRGLRPGRGGMDHRYYYARWDGSAWRCSPMAYAGTRLYPGEDDYTGLVSLDPNDPGVAYLSTNADPSTGAPLVSAADGRRHHELFRASSRDGGSTWRYDPVTADSPADNLRPIVPRWADPGGRTPLVWMRGTYTNNRGAWSTAVVATVLPSPSGP